MARCLNCMKEYDGFQEECPECGFIRGTPAKEGFHMNPGMELKERYIVGTVTSYGGFGVVYVGWDTMLKCKVAVKEYFPSGLVTREPGSAEIYPVKNGRAESEFRAGKDRFLTEAQIMSRYDGHPNIVSIMDYFEENGTAYIIMEFLEGQTLKQYTKSVESLDEKVDIETAVSITVSMCDILAELHSDNILHRDIAPDNIFICLGGKVKLIDFGAARLADRDKKLTKVLKMGFAPPEQYSTDKEQGPYTDVYALGATLYRVITGEMPDEASNRASLKEGAIAQNDTLIPPCKINPDIPEQLSNTILRAMAITPAMRFQTMQEFKQALEGKTQPLDPREELRRRKRKRIFGVSAAVVVIVVGSMLGINLFQDKKIKAELPAAEMTIWIPSAEGDAAASEAAVTGNMDVVLSEFRENYPHVLVQVIPVPEESYTQKLAEAKKDNTLPTLFLQRELQENEDPGALSDLSSIETFIDINDYYFGADIQKAMKHYLQLPMGYVETVLYEKKDAAELGKAERIQLLESQCSKGFDAALEEFRTGKTNYLIAGTDFYYEFFENSQSEQIEVNHVVNAGNIKIEPFLTEHRFGCFVDFWCVGASASEEEKQCAQVLLAYLMSGNCQRSFYTVESSRLGTAAPLLKTVFDTNYFKNTVGNKMDFLQEDQDNLIFLNEYEGIDDYYKVLLEKVKTIERSGRL